MDKKNIIILLLIVIIGLLAFLAFWTPEATAPETTIEDIETSTDREETIPVPDSTQDEEPVVEDDAEHEEDAVLEDEEEVAIDDFTPVDVTDEYLGNTFENNTYRYRVDFPEDWYWERLEAAFLGPREDYLWLDPNSGFIEGEYGGMAHVGVWDTTIAERLAQYDDWSNEYVTYDTVVDGQPATRIEINGDTGLFGADTIYVWIERYGLLYEIGMHPPSFDEELFQRMINSFTFVE